MTIPLPYLKENVKLEIANFPADKLWAIENLEYGYNTKLVLLFNRPVWTQDSSYKDFYEMVTEHFLCWDSSAGQEEVRLDPTHPMSSLTIFYGGSRAYNNPLIGHALPENIEDVLQALSVQFPKIREAYKGTVATIHWRGNPFAKGSYSGVVRPKQWEQKFAPLENPQVGNLVFGGEQWSLDYQGFMNGGVDAGEKAATHILDSLASP